MYLVINKWVIAVKVSKYLRNHRTLDIGVLGYIGIVWSKEHSPKLGPFLLGHPVYGAMRTPPTAAMEGLLHVVIKVEAQAAIYRLTCNHQWKPKSTKYSDTKTSQDMEHQPINPSYLEGQIKWCRDIHVTSYSRSTRPMNALLLECIDGAWKGGIRGIASVMGSTPWYSR